MRKTQVELESRVIVGAHGVAAEEDHILTGKVFWVGIISVLIFVVGILWAWRIQVVTTLEALPEGPAPIPATIGQYEIGIVNQQLFQLDKHAEQKIAAQQKALENGWAEEPGVVAHPTLQTAKQRIIAGQAAQQQAPAPEQQAPAQQQAPTPAQQQAPTPAAPKP